MIYSIKRVNYERIDLEREELMTVTEAANALGLTLPGVIAAIQRGVLTEVIDEEAANPQRERRLLLRSEVEAEVVRRGRPTNACSEAGGRIPASIGAESEKL